MPDETSPERKLTAQQELDIVLQALGSLPPLCQQVFLLSRVHQLGYPEIAGRCGISVKTVEQLVGRALEACISRLESER